MPESRAKTKAGKQRHVAKTMHEFKEGDLQSSSGQTVTNPKQAVAIALQQTGQSKPQRNSSGERKGSSRGSSRGSGPGSGNARSSNASLARRLDQRLDQRRR
jgi:hypothetical protein